MSGFDLGGAVNSCAEWCSSAPIIRTIVGNPVFTALLITALIAIVVMGLYHYPIKQAGGKKGVRALLYVFLLVSAVMFVHHYAVMRGARDIATRKSIRDVFSSIQQSRESGIGTTTPIIPAYGGGNWAARPSSPEIATGGDCGCAAAAAPPVAGLGGTAHGGRGRAGARPDNVAAEPPARVALGGVVIEDVVLPATAGPFG